MKLNHTHMIALAASIVISKPTLAFGDDPNASAEPQAGNPDVILESQSASGFVIDNERDEAPDFSIMDKKVAERNGKTITDDDEGGDDDHQDDDTGETPEAKAARESQEASDKAKKDQEAADAKKREDEAAAAAGKAKEEKPKEGEAAFDAEKATKELSDIKPPKGMSPKSAEGWEALKGRAADAYKEIKVLQGRIDTLTKSGADPELKTKLEALEKEANELREFRQMIEIEEDPQFQKEFSEKLEKADTTLLDFLVNDPKLGLSKEVADGLKKAGLDSEDGQATLNEILNAVQKTGNVLLFERVKSEILKRNGVVDEKVARSSKLREQRDAFFAEHNGKQAAEIKEFQTRGDAHLNKIATGEWCNFKDVPKDATPEQKAAIDAHNKRVKEDIQPRFFEAIQKAHARDPETLVDAVYAMFERDEFKTQIAAKDKELAAAQKRIGELEKTAAGVRKIARVQPGAHDTGSTKPAATDEDSEPQDGGAALDKFLAKKKVGQ